MRLLLAAAVLDDPVAHRWPVGVLAVEHLRAYQAGPLSVAKRNVAADAALLESTARYQFAEYLWLCRRSL